ncbi:hypothetical protein ACIBCR_15550 [Micromonospora echinospora]|uniref:hypothetical protein n=1 Tax=Micromonospora echinospora TaxID=1877 RepID=UPI0037B98386
MTAQTPGRQPHNSNSLANIAAAVVVAIGLVTVSGLLPDSNSKPDPKPSVTAALVKTTTPAPSPTPTATPAPTSPITVVKPTVTPSRKPAPTRTAPEPEPTDDLDVEEDEAEPSRRTVHPGAFCAADDEGEYGWTVRGVRMKCSRKAGDDYLRWRRAG